MKATSLRRKTLHTALSCFLAFLLLQGILILAYNEHRQEEAENSLQTILQTKAEALERMDEHLRVFGAYLSVHAELARMFSADGRQNVRSDTLETVFDLARLTTQTSDFIDDVLFINGQGIGRSYATGLGSSLIDLVRAQYPYSDETRRDSLYFFFPNYPFKHDPQFAYVVPILHVDTPQPVTEKVGTIILACRSEYLTGLMELGISQEYTATLRGAKGSVIYSSSSEEPPPHHVYAARVVEGPGLTLEISVAPLALQMRDFFLQTLIGGILLFAITLLLNLRMVQGYVLRPVRDMVSRMIRVRQPQNKERLALTHIQELDVIVDGANHMIDSLAESAEAQLRTQSELLEARLRRNEMELYALQSQINPHFLFNTLQCIRALSVDGGLQDVADISTALSRLLRYSIQSGETVRIAEEIGVIEQYLRIIDIRYERRIRHTIEVPEDIRALRGIRMMIQPLVENAVVHGLAPQSGDGRVAVLAWAEEEDAVLEVRDDGAGFTAERLARVQRELNMGFRDALSREGLESFGLYNINRRMKLAYGETYGVEIHSRPGDTRLRLRFPARRS